MRQVPASAFLIKTWERPPGKSVAFAGGWRPPRAATQAECREASGPRFHRDRGQHRDGQVEKSRVACPQEQAHGADGAARRDPSRDAGVRKHRGLLCHLESTRVRALEWPTEQP